MMWLRLWRAFSPALRTGRSIHQALADDLNRLIFVALLKSVTVESLLCGGDFAVQLVKVGNESLAQGCSAILLSRDVFGLLCLEGRQSPFHRLNCDIRRTVMQRLAMNFLFEPLQVLGSERMRWRELGQPIGPCLTLFRSQLFVDFRDRFSPRFPRVFHDEEPTWHLLEWQPPRKNQPGGLGSCRAPSPGARWAMPFGTAARAGRRGQVRIVRPSLEDCDHVEGSIRRGAPRNGYNERPSSAGK